MIDANTWVSHHQKFKFGSTKVAANSIWYASKDFDGNSKTSDIVAYLDVNGDAKVDFKIGFVGVISLISADLVQ
jgi:hypothetical protein